MPPIPVLTEEMEKARCEHAQELYHRGCRNFLVREVLKSVDELSECCTIYEDMYGNLADELGMPYLMYGKVLIELAQLGGTNLLASVPAKETLEDDDDDDDENDAEGGDDDEDGEGADGNGAAENDNDAEDDDDDDEEDDTYVARAADRSKRSDQAEFDDVDANDLAEAANMFDLTAAASTSGDAEIAMIVDTTTGDKDAVAKSTTTSSAPDVVVGPTDGATSSTAITSSTSPNGSAAAAASSSASGSTVRQSDISSSTAGASSSLSASSSAAPVAGPSAGPSCSSSTNGAGAGPSTGGADNGNESDSSEEQDYDSPSANLQVAWEVLELATKIFGRQGVESRSQRAEAFFQLAEISMENCNYETAIRDYRKSLVLQSKLPVKCLRTLATIEYKTGLCLLPLNQFTDSINAFRKAQHYLDQETAKLKAAANGAGDKATETSIADLKELHLEIESKIEEVRETNLRTLNVRHQFAKIMGCGDGVSGSSSSSSGAASSSTVADGASKSTASAKPMDISHLVKRKKPEGFDGGSPAKRPAP